MSERVALSLDSLSVFNAAPGNLLVLLPDTPRFTIVAVTDAYLQATFTRREQLVGQSFLEVFAAPVKDGPVGVKMQASLEQVLQHRREHRLEEQRFEVMDPARGAYAYKIWRLLNRPVLDNKGTVHYIIHSVEDVTEVRQTQQQMSEREESLRASEQLIKATLDASQDMIQVFRAVRNKEGKIIDFEWILNNHASEAYYGDVIGQRLLVNNPGVVEEDIFDAFVQVTETGVPQQNERHYVHEQFDGWFYQSVVKLGDGVVTTTSDISERKIAELALQQSKSLLQAIINAPNIGIAVYRAVRDKQGKIIDFVHEYINRASVAMLGEDFTGKLFTDHGENATVQLPKFIEVLETGRGNSYIREAQFRGHAVWFAITNTPLDGERLVHTWEDITDRKKTEAEILRLKDEVAQKATDKYHALFYHMEQGFCIIEVLFDQADNPVDYRFLEANPVFEQQTGLKDAAGKTMRQLQPGHEEHWLQAYGNVAKTGESVHFEYEASHLSGGIWYEVYAFRVSPSANHQVALLVNDVTERKKAEEALRKSEQQFRSLVAASSNMVYRMSADWREMYLLEGKDVLADTVHTISDWVDKYIPVEERPSVQAAIEVAIRTRQPFLHEHRVILADGSIGWVYSRAVPILDEEGRIVEWLGAGSDITLRKRAEQQIIEFNVLLEEQVKKKTRELQESKDLLEAEHYFLEQVTDKSPHLIYVFDLEEQRFTYINKRVEQLVGRDQEYVYAMGPHLFQAILHPADLPKRQEYISRLTTLSEQEIRDHEFRIWTGNTFRWFRSKDSIFKKEDGVVKQVIGLAEDVTYEKMMQERIQREGGQMGLN